MLVQARAEAVQRPVESGLAVLTAHKLREAFQPPLGPLPRIIKMSHELGMSGRHSRKGSLTSVGAESASPLHNTLHKPLWMPVNFPRRGSRLKLLDCRRKDSEPVVVPHSLLFVWYFGPANGGETGSWKPCGFLDHQ